MPMRGKGLVRHGICMVWYGTLPRSRPLLWGSRWHLVQAIVIVQGLACALPWNVYVTESEFFTLRVHIPPFNRVLADNFENAQLLTSQAACASFLTMLINDG